MKDENGIEICCENCKYCETYLFAPCMICGIKHTRGFKPTKEALEARIAELQNELNIVQESERAEAQEADRLRADNEVLQKRVQEFSMELLDRTMKENKDVLERLKKAESEK